MTDKPALFAGIDPGLDGGIALYSPATGKLYGAWPMPTVDGMVGGKTKRKIDMHALSNLMEQHSLIITKAVVEEVGAMPGQGVTSMFNFGFSTACCHMALACHRIPYTTVTPSRWKLAMKIGADKEGARLAASRLLPHDVKYWSRKKDDGIAEAALLAYWLSRQEGFKSNDPMAGLM